MKTVYILFFTFIIFHFAKAQVDYCHQKKEELLGREIKIYVYSRLTDNEIRDLFNSELSAGFYDDKEMYKKYTGSRATITHVIDSLPEKWSYLKRVFVVKASDGKVFPLYCHNVTDTNDLDINACHKYYQSVYKQFDSTCFMEKENLGSFVDMAYISFACSLRNSGTDSILTIKRYGSGYAYVNLATYVCWKERDRWLVKGFYNKYRYDCLQTKPVVETVISEIECDNLVQSVRIQQMNRIKKNYNYCNTCDTRKYRYSVDIMLWTTKKNEGVFCIKEAYIFNAFLNEPGNPFYNLYVSLYNAYLVWDDTANK